jgi:hypothetical protein
MSDKAELPIALQKFSATLLGDSEQALVEECLERAYFVFLEFSQRSVHDQGLSSLVDMEVHAVNGSD